MPSVHSASVLQVAGAGLLALALSALPAGATSRIKDLANIEGVRQNQLIGYGLVVGLNGTGDTLNNIPFTKQSLQAMLERMGVNIRGATIRTGNVAAVMVTGNLPAFGTQGTRMDVTVSALGDSKNLQGGTLLVTPLLGADGNVYAVAQGSVAVGGFQAEGEAAKITRGVPTVGRIANGAIIEREIEFALNRLPNVRLALRNADFTTAKRIAAAVNDFLGVQTAEPIDPSTVQLSIPAEFKGNVVAFLTEIEQLQVEPDLAAKIVIDERSGIIVMGRDVRVATVAVAQGNLTVTISESPQVSQPNAFSRGRTVVTPRSSVGVTEDGKKFAVVKDGVSLQQLSQLTHYSKGHLGNIENGVKPPTVEVAGACVRLKVNRQARRVSLRLDRTRREIVATAPTVRVVTSPDARSLPPCRRRDPAARTRGSCSPGRCRALPVADR